MDCSKLALIVSGETKAASLWIVNVLPMSTLPRNISTHTLYCIYANRSPLTNTWDIDSSAKAKHCQNVITPMPEMGGIGTDL